MTFRIGDQVRYFTDDTPGTVTAVWFEQGTGWVAEVDGAYTCFMEDLVSWNEEEP